MSQVGGSHETLLYLGRKTLTRDELKGLIVFERKDDSRTIKAKISQGLMKILNTTGDPQYLSPALWGSYKEFIKDQGKIDIMHLHWIQGEFISLSDISIFKGICFWTLHDMWPILGIQHYPGRLSWAARILDRACKVKKEEVAPNIIFHCTTYWMEGLVKKRYKKCKTVVIPYPINTQIFKPRDKCFSRQMWGIDSRERVILFGAVRGKADKRKGWELLKKALKILDKKNIDYRLVIFGNEDPNNNSDTKDLKGDVISIGAIQEEEQLSYLYSTADVMVVPSYIEAYGQTASESISCGVPVVVFDNSGLAEVVEHGKTGYLAESFNAEDLANGIQLLLMDDNARKIYSDNCIRKARTDWSEQVVGKKMLEAYVYWMTIIRSDSGV